MKKVQYSLIAILLIFLGCSKSAEDSYKSLSLLEYGMPITIMAPDSAKVTSQDLGMMKDVTVKSGSDYYIQILSSDARTNDIAKVKAEQLVTVKQNPFFSEIVQEDPAGFIFETRVDSSFLNYGFRFAQLKGNREYIIQTGLIGTFTKEEVMRMYKSVQPIVKK